jgi:hypothetical protein
VGWWAEWAVKEMTGETGKAFAVQRDIRLTAAAEYPRIREASQDSGGLPDPKENS